MTDILSRPTLSERRVDQTRALILDVALRAIQESGVPALTVREVAAKGGLSERTVFRYFTDREALLDAVAGRVVERLAMPAPPDSLEAVLAAPARLYACYEKEAALLDKVLHSDISDRIRARQGTQRWAAVRRVIDELAPGKPERKRKITAARVRFYLSASTWHYFRFYFKFTLEETVEAAQASVRAALRDLAPRRIL